MSELVVDVVDEAGTARLAQSLAAALILPRGSVISLCGPLGAGKTRLVRALAAALGVNPDEVASPTFVLLHEYAGTRPIYHCDAYRLRSARELWELGIEEMFAAEAITLIEWADRVADALPAEYLEVRIEVTGDTSRRFTLRAIGAVYESVIDTLRRAAR
ncbi:MAG: tRNA (adenosine(37)-N6)-threonylcarbamoyltransferase complex ATPase subunit type 1 TsaE [Pirellulales bacterium]|nr:tRNA (adenosine(37)-N6)-threonylcarbamoyltransferase complex ATPase subunit type 1 TsaE [Pirellulales bacterium]